MGSQRVGHNLVTEQQQTTENKRVLAKQTFLYRKKLNALKLIFQRNEITFSKILLKYNKSLLIILLIWMRYINN